MPCVQQYTTLREFVPEGTAFFVQLSSPAEPQCYAHAPVRASYVCVSFARAQCNVPMVAVIPAPNAKPFVALHNIHCALAAQSRCLVQVGVLKALVASQTS